MKKGRRPCKICGHLTGSMYGICQSNPRCAKAFQEVYYSNNRKAIAGRREKLRREAGSKPVERGRHIDCLDCGKPLGWRTAFDIRQYKYGPLCRSCAATRRQTMRRGQPASGAN